ncbi:hypothetical protein [Cupriavidus sp. SW-Y-13]|uniref:hypothetical protein n=1 Tax=Cupriavidus sp. SW-Y-13 TaxID=2653854 RepID=UPI0013667B23|nr:hypothetical protein [Cupriavidus sp. SW-Y-13]MWL87131.1 hypothetical protein [Cupriavidus sp. SW-Y-13]
MAESSNAFSSELVDQLALAVAEHVNAPVPLNVALWNVECIARYLMRSIRVVRERIVVQTDFPAPIRIPSMQSGGNELTQATPLWEAAEVIAWARSYKQRAKRTARHASPQTLRDA